MFMRAHAVGGANRKTTKMLGYAALEIVRNGGRNRISYWSNQFRKMGSLAKLSTVKRCSQSKWIPSVSCGRNTFLEGVDVKSKSVPCVSHTNRKIHTSKTNSVLEDHCTKSLTIWQNIIQVKSSPIPALTLGLSGLIPFVAAPTYMISVGQFAPQVAFAQVVYGACILSFLGGVRWGFTIPEENPIQPDWVNLGYSVTPSLVACLGLLLPTPFSLLTVMAGLTVTGYFDMAMYGYPPWFKGLRFTLSFVALLSLWTTFMCSFLIGIKDQNDANNEKDKDVD